MATTTTTAVAPLPINTTQDLIGIGDMLARSGIMGIRNPADGVVIAATCIQEKISFLKFSETYHIVNGRPAVKSEAMRANFYQLGGEMEIVERSAERAEAKFTFKKASFVSSLAWQDAQTEDYTRASTDEHGKLYPFGTPVAKRRLKDNWSTPRRRMQMLWARCVSDGVRAVCPQACRGCYTPEEVMDFEPREQQRQPVQIQPDQAVVSPPAPFPEPVQADPKVCNCDGPYKGMKWADIPAAMLEVALTADSPNIGELEREEIRKAIENQKEQNGTEPNAN